MCMKNTEYEIRSAQIGLDSTNPESRTVQGYAIVFDTDSVDLGGFIEQIKRSAVSQETIDKSDILCLLNHDEQKVLARSKNGHGSMELWIDEHGLGYRFTAPNTAAGDELIEQLKRGDISASSFAFSISPEAGNERWYRSADGTLRRDILHIERLYDCSPVYFPAYETTSCTKRSIAEMTEEEKRAVEEMTAETSEKVDNDTPEVAETVTENNENDIAETVENEVSENIEESAVEPTEENQEENVSENVEETADTTEETVTEEVTETVENEVSENTEETVENDITEEPQERSLDATDNNKIDSNIRTMKENFSLLKALRSVAFNERADEATEAVLNAGTEEFRNAGREMTSNIYLPAETRAITVTNEHDDTVEVDFQGLLTPLYENTVLLQNAKKITGLKGDIKYPIIGRTNPGALWEGEITTNTESTNLFDSITLSPKRISTTVIVSRQFIMQESVGAENAIRSLLVESLAQKLESTFMSSDAGTSTKPQGLFYDIEPDTVADFKGLAELEAKAVANCKSLDSLEYILDPKAWAQIRSTFTYNAKTTRNVLENSEIDGRKFSVSQYLGNKQIALVDFNDIIIAQWGGTSIDVDATSVTMSRNASVAITLNAWFDFKVLRPESVYLANLGASNNIAEPENDTIDPSVGA